MKKISLKNLSNDEILTRDELKRISGGNGSGPKSCSATATCGHYPSVTCNGTHDCVSANNYYVACVHDGGTTVVKCPGVV